MIGEMMKQTKAQHDQALIDKALSVMQSVNNISQLPALINYLKLAMAAAKYRSNRYWLQQWLEFYRIKYREEYTTGGQAGCVPGRRS